MPRPFTWTDEQLILAVKSSITFRGVIKALGLQPFGGNYVQIKRRIGELSLDVSHFKTVGWNKNPVNGNKVPVADYLVKSSYGNVRIKSDRLLKKLISEGLKSNKCEQCNLIDWHGQSLSFELHHCNGDHFDNRIENLKILCPNCHSIADRKLRNGSDALLD